MSGNTTPTSSIAWQKSLYDDEWMTSPWTSDAAGDMMSPEWNSENANFSWTDKLGRPTPEGIGWNNSTFEGVGSLLGGVGSLAQAWAGLQGVKLGKERLAMQDKQFGANFTNQATLLNNQINKHNNWAAANKIANRYDNIETNYRNIG